MTNAEKIRTLSAILTDLEYLTIAKGIDGNLHLLKIRIEKGLRNELERISLRLIVFRAWCSIKNEHATKNKIDSLLAVIKL